MNLRQIMATPGPNAIPRFLESWHGAPEADAHSPMPDGALPGSVRRFAAEVARWPRAIVQNELANDPPEVRDGDKRVFYIENQGVYLWATDGVAADPVVWGRYNEPGDPWQAEREPLSRFLLQLLVVEAVIGTDIGASASWLTLEQVSAVLGPLEFLPLGSWRWPAEPTWFFGGDDVLALVMVEGSPKGGPADRFGVWVAAKSVERVRYLRSVAGVSWERPPP